MPRTKEQYQHHSEWREPLQQAFWEALERVSPCTFDELDAIARRWAEVAPGRDVEGFKFAVYGDVQCSDGFYKMMEEASGATHIPGGGVLSDEYKQEREAWQKRRNLATPWLSRLADIYILSAHTGTHLTAMSGHFTAYDPNRLLSHPPHDVIGDPAKSAAWYKDFYRDVLVPTLGLSEPQTIGQPYHLEWTVLYQCERIPCADIAGVRDESTVAKAVKRVAEIIDLPLRKLPKGRKVSA